MTVKCLITIELTEEQEKQFENLGLGERMDFVVAAAREAYSTVTTHSTVALSVDGLAVYESDPRLEME